MSEHELSESVSLARDRLTALCARLEAAGATTGWKELAGALHELHEMLDKMQARYGLLCEILDRTNDMVFAKDRDGRYAMINPQGADMFGRTIAEILGADDQNLFEDADADRIMAIDREVMRTGEPRTREESCTLRGVRTALLTTTTPWYDGDRRVRGVFGISQDVTEHRRGERETAIHQERMRSMAAGIVISEERLRRALAAELHSGLGQDIALAKLKLSMLRSSASVELHDPLSGIEHLVERADRSLRSITFQISPPSLHDLGLVAALEWLAEDVGKRYGIDVSIEDAASPEVTDERVRVILFRAVRELLINAATHAHVHAAAIRLSLQGGQVRVTIEDSGVGFDAVDYARRGYGLFGIREQLEYVGGSMDVASAPGHGTTVTLTAPASEPVTRSTT